MSNIALPLTLTITVDATGKVTCTPATVPLVPTTTPPPNDLASSVLVVYNVNTGPEPGTNGMDASFYVAKYYMAARGIPAANLVHTATFIDDGTGQGCQPGGPRTNADPGVVLKCNYWSSTNITLADYKAQIEAPILAALAKFPAGQIKYIVPVFGVPINLRNPDSVQPWDSVDSHIANLIPANLGSPFFVTRLDGISPVMAAGLVDKALAAETNIVQGIGYFDSNGLGANSNGGADLTMTAAAALCTAIFGQSRSLLNNQQITKKMIQSAPNCLWAWGWYDLAAANAGAYSFAPGAVGAQLTSNTATCVRTVPAGTVCQGAYVADWLARGITATWGAIAEPGVYFYTKGDVLLGNLWSGLTFGESAYKQGASYQAYPQMVFVGDPLYRPKLR